MAWLSGFLAQFKDVLPYARGAAVTLPISDSLRGNFVTGQRSLARILESKRRRKSQSALIHETLQSFITSLHIYLE